MDTTKQYIKMCEKAQEIQESKVFHHLGDFIFQDGNVKVVNGYLLGEGCNEYKAIYLINNSFIEQWFMERQKQTIWLLRQDQLQEMTELLPMANIGMLQHLCLEVREEYYNKFKSMEQLWLAVVYDVEYDKIWNFKKEDWELINN